jgi:hypothetical protein
MVITQILKEHLVKNIKMVLVLIEIILQEKLVIQFKNNEQTLSIN